MWGADLNQHCESNGVRLKNPDVKINLEIDGEELFIVSAIHQGLSGMPIATQEDVLSLLSGGFDSGVASFQFIKRGCRVHYCFFNLGGAAHEIGVKQVAYHLWNRFGSSHRVRFTAVDFRAGGRRDPREDRQRSDGRGAQADDDACCRQGG